MRSQSGRSSWRLQVTSLHAFSLSFSTAPSIIPAHLKHPARASSILRDTYRRWVPPPTRMENTIFSLELTSWHRGGCLHGAEQRGRRRRREEMSEENWQGGRMGDERNDLFLSTFSGDSRSLTVLVAVDPGPLVLPQDLGRRWADHVAEDQGVVALVELLPARRIVEGDSLCIERQEKESL